MNTHTVQELYNQFVLPTYRQTALCLVKGKGSRVWDLHGKAYLDFFPGWAVSGLGHCHPLVTHAIKHQANKLLHVPNNFLSLKQARLAHEIINRSFPGKVFFCNSGAEAVEAALKCARRFGSAAGRYEVISMEGSFHGRTLGALTATGQAKYREGFGPLPEGFRYAKFNDLDSVKKLINEKTVAILAEPIQGEGGIRVAEKSFVEGLRKLADEHKLLLIFDEVQTGLGRTGTLFAYQQLGVTPDLMMLAKSLGGGVPIGALVVGEAYASVLGPGTHASTYGGNPLVASAALAVFKAIDKGRLLAKAKTMGDYLYKRLEALKARHRVIQEIRGRGLMIGVELDRPGAPVVERCLHKGLLINCTQERVLRIMPAMIVTKREIDQAMRLLDEAFAEVFG